MSPPPKITLYTANPSVYGQRVNILLNHLQVPFTQVIIPLDRPREPWYLAINPHGMVPALEVEDATTGRKETVIESALICHFLLDLARGWDEEFAARAEEIYPQGRDLASAVTRYRQNLFLDISFTKLRAAGKSLAQQRTEEAQQAFVKAVKQLEPDCPQPGHYFGDSDTISLVEVFMGPYLIRAEANMRWGLTPNSDWISERIQAEAPKYWAWIKKLAADEAIKAGTWDEEHQRKYSTAMFKPASVQK